MVNEWWSMPILSWHHWEHETRSLISLERIWIHPKSRMAHRSIRPFACQPILIRWDWFRSNDICLNWLLRQAELTFKQDHGMDLGTIFSKQRQQLPNLHSYDVWTVLLSKWILLGAKQLCLLCWSYCWWLKSQNL